MRADIKKSGPWRACPPGPCWKGLLGISDLIRIICFLFKNCKVVVGGFSGRVICLRGSTMSQCTSINFLNSVKPASVALHIAYLLGVGKVMGSMLRPNCVIYKDVKSCTFCCYVRCATSIVCVGGNALAPNWRNSVPCTVRTFRQRSSNQ